MNYNKIVFSYSMIFFVWSDSFSPWKRATNRHISPNMQPRDHISTSLVYLSCPLSISRGRYQIVIHPGVNGYRFDPTILVKPISAIFTFPKLKKKKIITQKYIWEYVEYLLLWQEYSKVLCLCGHIDCYALHKCLMIADTWNSNLVNRIIKK